jgi:thymidylate synthase (FAD)
MIKLETEYPVLDKGFIIFKGSLGNDKTIVDAARVSYQKGTKKKSTDDKLLDYLIRNNHTSPLEMVEFMVQVKAPIFVARQWFRHRMAEYNEMSLRYSECPEEFYRPAAWRTQNALNKQASADDIVFQDTIDECYADLEVSQEAAIRAYNNLLANGVAREQARIVLPVSAYTTWYWKANLRSLSNFVGLRDHDGAQYEIREYAKVLKGIIKEVCPVTYAAMEKHLWNH